MSERWIKLTHETMRKPEIFRVARALGVARLHAVGMLAAMWAWFDEQTTDGELHGVSSQDLDALVEQPGFAAAVESVEWLEITSTGLVMPGFEEHCSQSAKNRASDARRKRLQRKSSVDSAAGATGAPAENRRPQKRDSGHLSGSAVTSTGTRGEERRLETEPIGSARNARGIRAEPSRVFENQDSSDEPQQKLTDWLRQHPKLRELTAIAVNRLPKAEGYQGRSVFSELPTSAFTSWPLPRWCAEWYARQLVSRNPVLPRGHFGEAALTVAVVLAVQDLRDAEIKKSRIAMFAKCIGSNRCDWLSESHVDKACEVVQHILQNRKATA